jgi:hypothetical protein
MHPHTCKHLHSPNVHTPVRTSEHVPMLAPLRRRRSHCPPGGESSLRLRHPLRRLRRSPRTCVDTAATPRRRVDTAATPRVNANTKKNNIHTLTRGYANPLRRLRRSPRTCVDTAATPRRRVDTAATPRVNAYTKKNNIHTLTRAHLRNNIHTLIRA